MNTPDYAYPTPSHTSVNVSNSSHSIQEQRESLIKLWSNEDNLYWVYRRINTTDSSISLEVVPDIVCVNLDDYSKIQGIDNCPDITIVSGAELRKSGKLKYLAWKILPEWVLSQDFSRVSVGTIELIPAKNNKWDTNWHVATVHRGRTGYKENWDQRTTTAGWALGGDLHKESLREAVEEGWMIGINAKWEYELCLPTIDSVDNWEVRNWMNLAIDTFLSTNGKYDLMLSKEWATQWDPVKIEAWEYARRVFSRNFHRIDKKYRFGAEKLWEILQDIKTNNRYSFRKSETLNQEQIDSLWIGVKLQKFRVQEGDTVREWMFWADDDKTSHTPHAFRIVSNIEYPDGFTPIFRFYSESWVHYARNPRIENASGKIDTQWLQNPSAIDMKPVPFLAKFAQEATIGKVNKALNT